MLAIVAFAAGRYHVFRWGGSPLRVAEAACVRGEGVLRIEGGRGAAPASAHKSKIGLIGLFRAESGLWNMKTGLASCARRTTIDPLRCRAIHTETTASG
jgi:hypothetical protein